MKIAIVLSGLLRNFEHTSYFFKKYIDNCQTLKVFFGDLSVDYFFYGYANKSGINACNENLVKLLNPKKYEIIEWNESVQELIKIESKGIADLDEKRIGATSAINCLSSHRCKNKSNTLRTNWAKENNVKHDIVVFARIDSFFFREITENEILEAMQDNVILSPPDWDFKCVHKDAICDMFAMGNEETMNLYFESYKEIPSLVREKNYFFHPETLQGAHILHSGIKKVDCKRHFAFEYPYSRGDVLKLWEKSWRKSEIESMLSISLDELHENYRYST